MVSIVATLRTSASIKKTSSPTSFVDVPNASSPATAAAKTAPVTAATHAAPCPYGMLAYPYDLQPLYKGLGFLGIESIAGFGAQATSQEI
jgi:hypothetical protein